MKLKFVIARPLEKLEPIYNSIYKVKKDKILKNKDLIGFVGAHGQY